MARTKATLGLGVRLTDHLNTRVLAMVYPPEMVQTLLNEHGVGSQRLRSLPMLCATHYCMALSLYPEAAYEEVFSVVAQGRSGGARDRI